MFVEQKKRLSASRSAGSAENGRKGRTSDWWSRLGRKRLRFDACAGILHHMFIDIGGKDIPQTQYATCVT